MSDNVCSVVRAIPNTIWSKKPEPVPEWILELVEKIVSDEGVPSEFRPRVAVTSMPCGSHFAGRWFHQVNGVAVALQPSLELVRGVVVHETCHWLSWIRFGDEAGEHDERFYENLRRLYPRYGVSLKTALTIDHHSKDLVDWRSRSKRG